MARSPFIRVNLIKPIVAGDFNSVELEVDLTQYITEFSFSDSLSKGKIIEFRFFSDPKIDLGNNPALVAGAQLRYSFGFAGGVQTEVRTCRVSNVAYNLSKGGLNVEIKATDKGIELKKGTERDIYYDVTLSDIAKKIAAKYGLSYRGPETSIKYPTLVRTGDTDMRFLQSLMLKEDKYFHLQIDENNLVLTQEPRGQNAVRSYTFGEDVISFDCDVKEITATPKFSAGDTLDDKTGKKQEPSFLDTLLGNDKKTDGKFDVSTIANTVKGSSFFNGENGKKGAVEMEATTPLPSFGGSPNEASNKANNLNERAKSNVLEGKLSVELDPFLKAGDMVTLIIPLIERYSGNWMIEEVYHKIDNGGAFTEITLNKTGTDKPIKLIAKQNTEGVNKTQGSAEKQAKTRLFKAEKGTYTSE
jgi:hypothetical protein